MFRIHSWPSTWCQKYSNMAQGLRRIDPLIFDKHIADNWSKFKKRMAHILQRWTIRQNEEGASIYSAKFSRSRRSGKIWGFHIHWGRGQRRSRCITAKLCWTLLAHKKYNNGQTRFQHHQSKDWWVHSVLCFHTKNTCKKMRLWNFKWRANSRPHRLWDWKWQCAETTAPWKKTTLDSAVNICLLHEQSEKSTKELKHEAEVCAIQDRCVNCNRYHAPDKFKCFAFNKQCNSCGKWNHFAKCCRSAPSPKTAPQSQSRDYHPRRTTAQFRGSKSNRVNELNTTLNAPEDTFYCETVDDVSQRGEIFTTLHLKHRSGQLKLKVDTGAKCNVISAQQLHLIVPAAHINTNEKVNLIAYGGQTINTEGTTILDCEQGQLKFHVVDRSVRPLLGLQDTIAMGLIQLGPHVHAVANQEPEVQEFSDLFDTTALGKLPVVYHMRLDESVAPNVCAPRKVPIAMKEKVMAELERMTKLGVIAPETEATEWVYAMVAAKKKDGSVRICIDPVHLNKALLRPHHPLKTIEQVIADMPGAKVFSILDAKCGFWQIPLDEASSKLTTFMTPSGRYRFLRMPYGISTGSEVFQRTMEHLFDRQPCKIVVDDILVWGCTLQQHDERLKQVLHKIRASNMKLNPDKCKFRITSVSYVGHLLTADGIKPDPDKTAAVRQMPKPEDKQALQRFLGMTNYLSKFIPHYSDVTGPLRELLKQDAEWSWRELQDSAFQKLKDAVSSPPVLQYFDVTKPVVLSADASQHGLGAVCLQQGAPVAFASRALTPTESRYAQIENKC